VPAIAVSLQDARDDHSHAIPSETDFSRWVLLAVQDNDRSADMSGDITVRIVGRDEIRQLNSEYRGKDKPTNVLSFPYDDHPEGHIGDIVVCAPVVFEEAGERGIPEGHHWAHLVIHGVLHLLGYDHEDEEQATEMESREIALLAALDIPDPYEMTK